MPSSIIEPVWDQFAATLPPHVDTHPLGCHRRRISDRIVFDKLMQVLVFGVAYEKIADTTCSATTLRDRRDMWIAAGIFAQLEQLCLESYDKVVGLELEDITVDGCVVAAANRHDSPLLRPTLEKLGRFETRFRMGLPDSITVHLDTGYDSAKTRDLLDKLGCHAVISKKGFPLQAGARWVVERTNSWHTRGFKKLQVCTERGTRVINAFIALANAIIIVRRLIQVAWTTHRWDTRPTHRP